MSAAVAAFALSSTVGCGGSAPSAGRPAAPVGPAVVTPSAPVPCGAMAGLALPKSWPAGLPLPEGLVVVRTERRSGDRLIVTGRVPGDFHAVVTFFNARLPAAGFTPEGGQIDPGDAESDFRGAGVSGRWTAGHSPDCDGATAVTVLVQPVSASLRSPRSGR